jgi:hypothetical protein
MVCLGDGVGEMTRSGDGVSRMMRLGDGVGRFVCSGDGVSRMMRLGDGVSRMVRLGDGVSRMVTFRSLPFGSKVTVVYCSFLFQGDRQVTALWFRRLSSGHLSSR